MLDDIGKVRPFAAEEYGDFFHIGIVSNLYPI
jgi:hypothetical protein